MCQTIHKRFDRGALVALRPRSTSMTVGAVVRGYKIGVTKWMRQHASVTNMWHRNYWEHIVRNPAELARIRRYSINNPMRWELDRMNAAKDTKYGRGSDDWKPPEHGRARSRSEDRAKGGDRATVADDDSGQRVSDDARERPVHPRKGEISFALPDVTAVAPVTPHDPQDAPGVVPYEEEWMV